MLQILEQRAMPWALFTCCMFTVFWCAWTLLDATKLGIAERGAVCLYLSWLIDSPPAKMPRPTMVRWMRLREQNERWRAYHLICSTLFFAAMTFVVWFWGIFMQAWYQSIAFYVASSFVKTMMDASFDNPGQHMYNLVWSLRFTASAALVMFTMGWAYMFSWQYPPYHVRSPSLWLLVLVYMPSRHTLRGISRRLVGASDVASQRYLDVAYDLPMTVVLYTIPTFHVVWLAALVQLTIDCSVAGVPGYRCIFPASQLFWTHLIGLGFSVYLEHDRYETISMVFRRVMLAVSIQILAVAWDTLANYPPLPSGKQRIVSGTVDFLAWARQGASVALSMLGVAFGIKAANGDRNL